MKKTFRGLILAIPLLTIAVCCGPAARAETLERDLRGEALLVSHREMFASGDFAHLDESMNKMQAEYEKGQWTDGEFWSVLSRDFFLGTDPALEELYNKWVAAYPNSYAARLARGTYFYNIVRATSENVKVTAKMTPETAALLKRDTKLAVTDNLAALKMTAKPIWAYRSLIHLYALAGTLDKSRKMVEQADEIVPRNLIARVRYMSSLDESGASLADMRAFMQAVRKIGLGADEMSVMTNTFHARLLKEAQYAELDKEMSQLQQDYEAGKIDDITLNSQFSIFAVTDPALEKKFNAWVAAYPRSYAAREARSRYLTQLGFAARGARYIQDTSNKEISGMELYLKRALEDAKAAQSLSAKPLLAYDEILNISNTYGARKTCREMLEMANIVDPKNYVVRLDYMNSLQTRWGGSLEKMENFLDTAKAVGIPDYKFRYLKDMIVEEKLWLADRMAEKYSDVGQVVTGF